MRTLNRTLLNATTADGASILIVTPPPISVPPFTPAHRLEFMVRPSLIAPFGESGRALLDAMAANMVDPHFLLPAHSRRLQLAEVSSTGERTGDVCCSTFPPPISPHAQQQPRLLPTPAPTPPRLMLPPGSFVMIDVVPEDVYAYHSGPDVPRILLRYLPSRSPAPTRPDETWHPTRRDMSRRTWAHHLRPDATRALGHLVGVLDCTSPLPPTTPN